MSRHASESNTISTGLGMDKTAPTEASRESSRISREPPELIKRLSTDERAALEQRLLRKIDMRLMPLIILMYILNYLDRNNIASARLQGLQEDLQLTDVQYQVRVCH